MTPSRISKSDGELGDVLFLSGGDLGSGRVTIQAMGVLDLLVAVKIDLTTAARSAVVGPSELEEHVTRACETIEVAIGELKRLAGLSRANGEDFA